MTFTIQLVRSLFKWLGTASDSASDFIYFLGRSDSPRYRRRYVPTRLIFEILYALL